MTSWSLLAIQFVGTVVLTFFVCRHEYNKGRKDGYAAGYAVGKMDRRPEAR